MARAVRAGLDRGTPWCRHRGASCTRHCMGGALRGLCLALALKLPLELLFRSLSLFHSRAFATALPPFPTHSPPGERTPGDSPSVADSWTDAAKAKATQWARVASAVPTWAATAVAHSLGSSGGAARALVWARVLRPSLGKDTAQFCAFMAAWIAFYRGALCVLRRLRPRGPQQVANSAMAGAVCGLAMLFDGQRERKTELAVYLAARALVACWPASWQVPAAAEVLCFCVLAGFTQYSYVYEPDLMRRQYFRFIDELAKDPQGRLDKFLLFIRGLWRTRIPPGLEVMERSSSNTDHYYTGRLSCPDAAEHFNEEMEGLMERSLVCTAEEPEAEAQEKKHR